MPLTIEFRPVLDAADLYRRADKDLRTRINRAVNREVNPWLRSAIRRGGTTGADRKLGDTARIRAGTNPAVVVGGAKKFSGGAKASDLAGALEFGAYNPYRKVTYTRRYSKPYRRRSRNGGSHMVRPSGSSHKVKRSTAAQIPRRSPSGRFIMDAVARAAPMMVGAWVRTIIDAYDEGTR